MPEYPGLEFRLGQVGLGVRTDGASVSGSLHQLIFRVWVLVMVKDSPRGAMARRAEGPEGYKYGVGNTSQRCYSITKLIYFCVLRSLLYNVVDYRAGKKTAQTTRGCVCHDALACICGCA